MPSSHTSSPQCTRGKSPLHVWSPQYAIDAWGDSPCASTLEREIFHRAMLVSNVCDHALWARAHVPSWMPSRLSYTSMGMRWRVFGTRCVLAISVGEAVPAGLGHCRGVWGARRTLSPRAAAPSCGLMAHSRGQASPLCCGSSAQRPLSTRPCAPAHAGSGPGAVNFTQRSHQQV